jgi:hypothetical protein
VALFGLAALAPSPALAQAPPDMSKFMGTPITQGSRSSSTSGDPVMGVKDSYVSILDSAYTRNVLRLRFDAGWTNRRPTRAEFFQSKGGVAGGPGPPRPETNVDYQEATAYAEWSPIPFVSMFVDTPVRWINPDQNVNTWGYGDTDFGLKLCTWTQEQFIATFQLKVYNPTAQRPGLGTDHWTIEPGLLAIYQPYDNITVEGELRYWIPLGGTDFAGDTLRYGLGASLGQRSSSFWIMPVVEAVGWTVLGGKELVVAAPDAFTIRDANDQTILNGYLGCRFGFGPQLDFYAGYGRCFTGAAWSRNFGRLEMRFLY